MLYAIGSELTCRCRSCKPLVDANWSACDNPASGAFPFFVDCQRGTRMFFDRRNRKDRAQCLYALLIDWVENRRVAPSAPVRPSEASSCASSASDLTGVVRVGATRLMSCASSPSIRMSVGLFAKTDAPIIPALPQLRVGSSVKHSLLLRHGNCGGREGYSNKLSGIASAIAWYPCGPGCRPSPESKRGARRVGSWGS